MAKCKRGIKKENHRIFKTSCVLRRNLPQVERLVTRPMIIHHIVEHIKRENLQAAKKRYCHLDATLSNICDMQEVPEDPVRLAFIEKCLSRHLLPLKPAEIRKYQKKIDQASRPYTVTEDGYVCRKSEKQVTRGDGSRDRPASVAEEKLPDGMSDREHLSLPSFQAKGSGTAKKNAIVVPSAAGLSTGSTLGETAAAAPPPAATQEVSRGSVVGTKRNWGCFLQ